MKFLILMASVWMCVPSLAEVEKSKRTCRLIFPQRENDTLNEVYLFDGKSSHKIELSSMNFSEVIHLSEGDLVLSLTAKPVTEAKDLPEGAPNVRISSSIKDMYLVVLNDAENTVLPVRLMPYDIAENKLMPGETLWINLSKNRITGELGDQSISIGENETIVSKAPRSGNGYYKAIFHYQPPDSEKHMPVMTKSWWFDSSCRNLGFMVDTDAGTPKIFSFKDQR